VYGTRHNDQTGLILREIKSGDEKWLAYPVQRDEQESIAPLGVLPAMSFTPDSKEVVASYGGKFYRIPVAGGDAITIPFEMETEFLVGPRVDFKYPIKDDKDMIATQIRDAVVSPDGKQVALTVLNRLYLYDIQKATYKRITSNNFTEAQPTWSPDGSQLAWVTWENNAGHVYKLNLKLKDAKPVRLTTAAGLYTEPVWSYQGNKIVFFRGATQTFKDADSPFFQGAQEDLIWISSDGGPLNFIAKAKGRSNPHFTKSEDRIYLYNGQKGLLSIRWDGTDEKAHLRVTGITVYGSVLMADNCMLNESEMETAQEPSIADVIKIAPEGDKALAQINNEIYVITIPKTGGDTPKVSVAEADKAQFPSRKLTKLGGEFASWSSNAKTVYFTLGNAFFTYNLDSAKTKEDALKKKKAAEEKAQELEEAKGDKKDENLPAGKAGKDDKKDDKKDEKKDEGYKPTEVRIKVTVQKDVPQGKILLQNARIVTMKGDEVIESGDVLIENARITQVGAAGSIAVDGSVQKMDLKGKTIVPGFVDTHSHMWPAWGIHKNQVWMYAANLAYGVTTTRDPQTATTDVLTYGDMV
ncbi:MAG: amidohydrolase, partial [Cyclobacteriaceae bacterium]